MTDEKEEKNFYRSRMLQQRAMHGELESLHAARNISHHFLNTPSLMQAQHIAGYMHIRDEVPLLTLMKHLHEVGKTTYLPITHKQEKTLEFHPWSTSDALHTGAFGIAEPTPSSPTIPEIILIPLLACDAEGTRLGYGGGFYDRTLAHIHSLGKSPILLGIGYDFQYIDKLPKQPLDVTLHGLITPSALHWFCTPPAMSN